MKRLTGRGGRECGRSNGTATTNDCHEYRTMDEYEKFFLCHCQFAITLSCLYQTIMRLNLSASSTPDKTFDSSVTSLADCSSQQIHLH